MNSVYSLEKRVLAMMLCVVMVLGIIPVGVFAQSTAVAQIGDVTYNTLEEALAAVPTGTNQTAPAVATTIKLLKNTQGSFDLGVSTGAKTMNLILDLNGKTLTLGPAVGSVGTAANGIRVLAYSKLKVMNGTLACSDEAEHNVKVGIANYSDLVLEDVVLKAGAKTIYSINNRGHLTLSGKTVIEDGNGESFQFGITNDPYNLYYTTDKNATVVSHSDGVVVGSMQLERYARTSTNKGAVELDISAGYFGKIVEDGDTSVGTKYQVTGGVIGVSDASELDFALQLVTPGAAYQCPEKAVTIKLLASMSNAFDIGTSNGKAPKNVLLDLNGKTLTLGPGIGSVGTASNGIRVLAYSKLTILNGTIKGSNAVNDNTKVCIANYSELTLQDVDVQPGKLTQYTINNRGILNLLGKTSVTNGISPQLDYDDSANYIAITNDPYNLYYPNGLDAVINCASSDVTVGNLQVETYGKKGVVRLNISAGNFGGIYQPASAGDVTVDGKISGGTFDTDISAYCAPKYECVQVDGKYTTSYIKDDQLDIGFANPNPGTVVYGENGNKFQINVTDAFGELTYTVIEGTDVATVNNEGVLTIIKAGTVKVQIQAAGNEWYNPGEIVYTLVIEPSTQSGFGFEVEAPVDQWVGKGYTNVAIGGEGTGEITYEIIDGNDAAVIDAKTGEVTFLKTGVQIVVKATKAADDRYSEAIATYAVTAVKREAAEFAFSTTGPITLTYAPGLTYPNPVIGLADGETVVYAVADGADVATVDQNGVLTILKSGTVVVTATRNEDDLFLARTISYVLTVNKAEQSRVDLSQTPGTIVYKPAGQNVIAVTGGTGTGNYVFAVVEGNEYAEIDENTGVLTTLKAGTIVVEVYKEGDDCYLASETVSITIQIKKAEQSGFVFTTVKPDAVTYNENGNRFSNPVIGGQTDLTVVYMLKNADGELVESTDVAKIDTATGDLTILKAGAVEVVATLPGDDCYEEAVASYTLTIRKAQQSFTFVDTNVVTKYYGITSYKNEIAPVINESAADGVGFGTGAYTYSISNADAINAKIDAEGNVTFGDSAQKVDTVTVTVTKAADDCYEAVERSYTLKISFLETDAEPKVGTTNRNEAGWFQDAVIISAPEGYLISTTGELSTNDWAERIEHNISGGSQKIKVYLKNEDDQITDAIEIGEDINLDDENPHDLKIEYVEPVWKAFLNKITFGVFKSDKVEVTISAVDNISGIDYLTYTLGEETYVVYAEELTIVDGKASYTFEIEDGFRNTISMTAADVSGRKTGIGLDGTVLVVDGTAPEVSGSLVFVSDEYAERDGVYYTQGEVKVLLSVIEANFDLYNKPVVTVNGEEKEVVWTFNEELGSFLAEFTLTEENTYHVSLVYDDGVKNGEGKYEVAVCIDHTAPVISEVGFGEFTPVQDNIYGTFVETTITVEETNFDPADFDLVIEAVDINGNTVQHYATLSGWNHESGVHTATIRFEVSAHYTLTLNHKDAAGNAAKTVKAAFVVDTVAPENVVISYSKPIAERILEKLTFGLYQSHVVVTVTAEDQTSGIEYFELTYTQTEGSSSVNAESFKEKLVAVENEKDGSVFSASFTLPAQANGTFSALAVDKAGHSTLREEKTVVVVVDDIDPELSVEYIFENAEKQKDNTIFYVKDKITLVFTIKEANFDLADAPVVCVDSVEQTIQWKPVEDSDNWIGELVLTDEGDHIVTVTYVDGSSNQMDSYSKEIHIDREAPVINVTYDKNEAKNEYHFNEDRNATVTIVEHNFNAEDVVVTVIAEDILGNTVKVADYTAFASNPDNWTSDGDEHTLKPMEFKEDAIYHVSVKYTDLSGNVAEEYTAAFVIDHKAPENVQITYSEPLNKLQNALHTLTFGFYQKQAVITVTAEDITSGVDYFKLTYTKDENSSDVNMVTETFKLEPTQDGKTFTATHIIPANARGSFDVVAVDKADNSTVKKDMENVVIVDDRVPTISVTYTPDKDTKSHFVDADKKTATDYDAATTVYYDGGMKATIEIEEANFFEGKYGSHRVGVKVTKTDDKGEVTVFEYLPAGTAQMYEGAAPCEIEWKTEGDKHTAEISFADDGDYVLEIEYTDLSENVAGEYASKILTVDTTPPVIDVTYSNNDVKNKNCYKADRTQIITITEHNFKAEDVKVKVIAQDILGNEVKVEDNSAQDYYSALAANPANWKSEGNVHTLNLLFSTDAIYTVIINYADLAGNDAETFEDTFVIDHKHPDNLKIEYSESVLGKLISGLTFGFYQPDITVTVTAEDMISGVDFFKLTYTKEEGTTDAHMATDTFTLAPTAEGNVFTASLTLDKNLRGSFSAIAVDRAGNISPEVDDKDIVKVVDHVSPKIQVNFTSVDPETSLHLVKADKTDAGSFADAANAFYNGSVLATITVTEANFFEGIDGVHEVGIKVTRTDDLENETVFEYLPEGTKQKYQEAEPVAITWNTEGDVHMAKILLNADGDYVLELDYTDFSSNQAIISGSDANVGEKVYTSKIITVDTVAPVISVEYENKEIIHTIDGRDYLNANQAAVITVVEHNFRAADMEAVVKAVNVAGDPVVVEDFMATLKNPANWVKSETEPNTYSIRIEYVVDANYTFDIDFKDLAKNASAEYEADHFTVDKVNPENLTVSYSTSVLEQILSDITFGYYNAEMTVTITADDETSGIHYFVYSYLKGKGVSGVNAELIDEVIEEGEGRIVQNGKTFTATFKIPQMVLENNNQFNGTVEFTAHDRSEWSSELKSEHNIIVDNIKPTAKIWYNEPVQIFNGISYYAGDIDATIQINEANFFAEDVVVKVTKDGVTYPVNVSWYNNNVDVHTGTFKLTEDGDYYISVDYVDRSTNKMDTYTSNRLTLDTQAPVLTVSNVKQDSANKDEVYGFILKSEDINLDATSFTAELKATVRNEDGSYQVKTVSLGDMQTEVTGKAYFFTVENLTEDALYALTAFVEDMSGNPCQVLKLEDEEVYDQVKFSINRQGSTFGVDANTAEVLEKYYVYSVDNDVVIEEINVDPIETYAVKLNGKLLTEGTDYTTTQTSEDGQWSKRTYVINKSLFTAEGQYKIVVESTDKADSNAYSDVKNLDVSFVVDQTKPVITVSGLISGGRYQVSEQTVMVIPTDDGGRLNRFTAIVLDADGNPLRNDAGEDISVRFDMSGQELLEYLAENNGTITFTVPNGLENQVKLICSDCAVNADDLTNEHTELFEKVTVSESIWVIFYAFKPLFYGTIAGVVLLAAAVILLIVLKKKKKQGN